MTSLRDCLQPPAYSLQPDFGWRIYKKSASGDGTLYLYGPGGQLLHERSDNALATCCGYGPQADYAYFGGRLLYKMEEQSDTWTRTAVYTDRLGTVRARGTGTALTRTSYYPFGEEIGTVSANDTYKFASTYRDQSSGLDYAVNRYYASGMGRFLAVDRGPANLGDPQSLNRYAYAGNDPANNTDPTGLFYGPSAGPQIGWNPVPPDPSALPGGSDGMGVVNYSLDGGGGGGDKYAAERATLNQGLAKARDLIKKPECAGLFRTGDAEEDLQSLIDSTPKPAPSVAAIAQAAITRNTAFETTSQAATSILNGMSTNIEYSDRFNAQVALGGQGVTFSSLYLSQVIGGTNSMDDLTVTVLHEALHSLGINHGTGWTPDPNKTYGTQADMDQAIKDNCLK